MELGAFELDESGLRAWLESDQRFNRLYPIWDPLEIAAESDVIDLLEAAQGRQLLTGPALLGLIYLDDPDGDQYYITADLKHDADSDELRLTSAARDWERIVAEHQVGVEAGVEILAGIKAEGEALVRQLERFTAPGEQAAYDRAMQDSLDVTDGIEAHDTCGCGEPIALYEGEWLHVYNERLRGTDDHDADPG